MDGKYVPPVNGLMVWELHLRFKLRFRSKTTVFAFGSQRVSQFRTGHMMSSEFQ